MLRRGLFSQVRRSMHTRRVVHANNTALYIGTALGAGALTWALTSRTSNDGPHLLQDKDVAVPVAEITVEEIEPEQPSAYNPETGEINWDCPCLGGMASGPCGEEFKASFSCFVYSDSDPKGAECIGLFKTMQDCFRKHPEIYAEHIPEEQEHDGESEGSGPDRAKPVPVTGKEPKAQQLEEKATSAVSKTVEGIQNEIKVLEDDIQGTVGAAQDKARARVSELRKELAAKQEVASEKIEKLKTDIVDTASNVKSSARAQATEIKQKVASAKSSAESTASDAKQAAVDAKDVAISRAADLKVSGESKARDASIKAQELKSTVESKAADAKAWAESRASEISKSANDSASDAQSKISTVSESVEDQAKSLKDAAADKLSGATKKPRSASEKLKGIYEDDIVPKADELKKSAVDTSSDLRNSAIGAVEDAKKSAAGMEEIQKNPEHAEELAAIVSE